MTWQQMILKPDTLALLLPIAAIVVGGVVAIVHRVFAHSERMAMIERGLHPDFPPETEEPFDEGDVQP